MARKIVTVDESLRLPQEVEDALKADLQTEFQSSVDAAETAATSAVAAEAQTSVLRDEVVATQAQIEDTIHDWNVDTNDTAVAALINEEHTQTSTAIEAVVDAAVAEQGVPDQTVADLVTSDTSATGRAVRDLGAPHFASEIQRDIYFTNPHDGQIATTGTDANLKEWRYKEGAWVAVEDAWVPAQAATVPATGVIGSLAFNQMPVTVTIPDAEDLDTYVTPGIYHQNLNSQAASGSNYPIALAGLLEVFESAPNFIYQRYTPFSPGSVFFQRAKYADQPWRGWFPVGETRATLNANSPLAGSATVIRNGNQVSMIGNFTGTPGSSGGYSDVFQVPLGFRPGQGGLKTWCASSAVNDANRNCRFIAIGTNGDAHILFSGAWQPDGTFTSGPGGTGLIVAGLTWTTDDAWPAP